MEEFDLLGHLHDGESTSLHVHQSETIQVLLWKKLDINGYVPAAREGHTSICYENKVYIFGGMEGSKRVNSTIRLDLTNQTWTFVKAVGSLPSPRTNHATINFENFMVVQGGEGLKDQVIDYQEEPLLDFPSSTLDGAGMTVPTKALPGQLAGVCPGDTLQGLKMGSSLKVQKVPSQITLTLEQSQKIQQVMSCFDDFHVLDVTKSRWYEVKTSLAPLPRKGHSINVVNLSNSGDASKNCFVVFGGYSTDNLTVSNSLLACSVEHVVRYIQRSNRIIADGKDIADYEQQGGQPRVKRAFNADYDLQPVVWRTLPTKGASPPGRFRHTCTIVKDNSGADMLVVIGGIGVDQSRPLNDVHILQCDTLTWIKLDSHTDGPTKGISLDGPFNGIYGHVGFPYSGHIHATSLLDNVESQGDEYKEIIVFGGSYDTSTPKSSCYPYLYAYNYTKDEWRKVPMSHQYPMSRTGHSFAIATGWTPAFDTPFSQNKPPASQLMRSSAGKNDISQVGNDFTRSSVIVFGGVTSAKAVNDTWALDLLYRDAGLDQYDNNTNQIIYSTIRGFDQQGMPTTTTVGFADDVGMSMSAQQMMDDMGNQQPETTTGASRRSSSGQHLTSVPSTKTIHSVNDQKYLHWYKSPSQSNLQDPKSSIDITTSNNNHQRPTASARDLKVSQSMPSLYHNGSQTSFRMPLYGTNAPEYQQSQNQAYNMTDGADEGDTIMKFKRERAITEIQLCQERNKNLELEAHVKSLESLNSQLSVQIADSTEKYESEISTLKRLLDESLRREAELKNLNQEANELLVVYSLSRLQHR